MTTFMGLFLAKGDGKAGAGFLFCVGGQGRSVKGETAFAPGIEAALERADALDSVFP
jgi:hypothetical protein